MTRLHLPYKPSSVVPNPKNLTCHIDDNSNTSLSFCVPVPTKVQVKLKFMIKPMLLKTSNYFSDFEVDLILTWPILWEIFSLSQQGILKKGF